MRRCLRQIVFFCSLLALLASSACERADSLTQGAETDAPNYRRGQQLVRSGRQQEALTAFLKVIEQRGENAPESHLEAGLIYLQHVKDPIAAIYHFRKYLELKPNAPQADLVRQRVDTAMKDFARTLPAQPLDNQLERLDMMQLVDQLKRENEQLKVDLAAARAGIPAAVAAPVVSPPTRTAVPSQTPQFNLGNSVPSARPSQPASLPAALPSVRTPAALPAATPSTRNPTPPSSAASAAAKAGRHHAVVAGETLSKISLKYYGDRSHVNEIYSANKDVMRSPNDIKVGMELKIP